MIGPIVGWTYNLTAYIANIRFFTIFIVPLRQWKQFNLCTFKDLINFLRPFIYSMFILIGYIAFLLTVIICLYFWQTLLNNFDLSHLFLSSRLILDLLRWIWKEQRAQFVFILTHLVIFIPSLARLITLNYIRFSWWKGLFWQLRCHCHFI
jgi:hypothetical protein